MKPKTIIELQKEFTQAVQRVNGHATVTHSGACTCGDKVLYKHATQIKLPAGIPVKSLIQPFKAVVEQFYAPVVRFEFEPCFTEGCDEIPGRKWQSITLIHE